MREHIRLTLGIVVLACLIGAGALPAAEGGMSTGVQGPSFGNPLEYLLQDGWQVVAPEVMRRELEDGRVETWAYGVRGLAWAVNLLSEELKRMESDYEVAPSDELWDAIQTHQELLAGVQDRLDRATHGDGTSLQPMALQVPTGCDISWGYHAYAYRGATAQADAYFSNTCGYVASTYAYAYVMNVINGVTNTKSQTDPSGPGTNISSYAYASLSGTADTCSSYASAYVDSEDFGFFEEIATNDDCDLLVVSISGPSYVYVPSGCHTVTWTANPSGGTGTYTHYAWTYNGSSVGSNSSTYSRTFCATARWTHRTDTVGVTVTDTGSHTASDTNSISVELGPTDPCIEPYSATSGQPGDAMLPSPCYPVPIQEDPN